MDTTTLGGTDRSITRVGLGAMPLSTAGRPDRDEAKAVLRRTVELGVTLVDTADSYCLDHTEYGHNERLIAETFSELGLDPAGADGAPLVATKGGMSRPGGAWGRRGRPDQLRAACEASLEALGVDEIALYQFHGPDPDVPFADSVGEIARLREEGKIRHVGLSNVTVEQIEDARAIVPVVSVQNRFNPWTCDRREVLDHCERHGITFLAYSPVGGRVKVETLGRDAELRDVAWEVSATPWEVTLAYLLALSPAVVVIPGASRVSSIESSVRAGDLALDDGVRRRVQKIFKRLQARPSLAARAVRKLGRIMRG